jgi:hypothetical protein
MSSHHKDPLNRYGIERGLHDTRDSTFRTETVDVPFQSKFPPHPGEESVGPNMYDLVIRTNRSIEVQNELLRSAIPMLNKRVVINYATGTTDGSGNLDLIMYRVPQGFQFITIRVVVEDATHSPGNPFTGAAAWIALIKGDKYAQGSIVDFLPNPPNANGVILPALFSDGVTEGPVFRGGESASIHINAGPPTTDIWARFQGFEVPL